MKKKVCYYLGEMVTKLLGHDLMKLTKALDEGWQCWVTESKVSFLWDIYTITITEANENTLLIGHRGHYLCEMNSKRPVTTQASSVLTVKCYFVQ